MFGPNTCNTQTIPQAWRFSRFAGVLNKKNLLLCMHAVCSPNIVSACYSVRLNSSLSQPLIHSLRLIKPLTVKAKVSLKSLATLDIETIEHEGEQIPVCLSLVYNKNGTTIIDKTFVLNNPEVGFTTINTSIQNLWLEFIVFSNEIFSRSTGDNCIFVHNLGGFDGYMIYKGLFKVLEPHKIQTLIDADNKFILIRYYLDNGATVTFKDSYRVLPVSLNELCDIFKVEGKSGEYMQDFNSMSVLKDKTMLNSLIAYNLEDSKALLRALKEAQQTYANEFNVDIATILSTTSLAMKVFRTNFLTLNIPILSNKNDEFIRKAYYGGATDYYLAKLNDCKYLPASPARC